MKDFNFFEENRMKYKANLHAHSKQSDGLLTQETMVEEYWKHGYSILAFSEHEVYTNTTEYDRGDFIVLPGIERSIMLDNETFHIHGIGDPGSESLYKHREYIPVPEFTGISDVQNIINELKGKDNLVAINHPYWSCNRMSNVESLRGYDWLEVYNHNCEVGNGTGNSEIYWDHLLWKNKRVNAIATDDNHNSHRYMSGINMWDSFGGWIMIEADELKPQAVFDSLKEGKFYASSGPIIHNYGMRNGKLFVECSPCATIQFKCYPRRGYSFHSEASDLTEASYDLRGGETSVRIICIDEAGKKAWSNPFCLE